MKSILVVWVALTVTPLNVFWKELIALFSATLNLLPESDCISVNFNSLGDKPFTIILNSPLLMAIIEEMFLPSFDVTLLFAG